MDELEMEMHKTCYCIICTFPKPKVSKGDWCNKQDILSLSP
jgi:hypothetical protein